MKIAKGALVAVALVLVTFLTLRGEMEIHHGPCKPEWAGKILMRTDCK